MENIGIFLFSTIIYFLLTEAFINYGKLFTFDDTIYDYRIDLTNLTESLKKLGIIALLCLPVNINGNVFTVAGNAVAEKSVYSVLSFYQEAENGKAVSLFGLGNVQIAKEGEGRGGVGTLVGFPSYQKSEGDSFVFIGFPLCQEGDRAMVAIGGSAIQLSKETSVIVMGVSGYQGSQGITIAMAGIVGCQKAVKKTVLGIGVVGCQNAGEKAEVKMAMALYQKVQNRDRAFALASTLTASASEKK